jgi:hypothetical protein
MKVSLKILLMLAIVTSSTPSHAQLGDLFRKLGDAVDSVVKKIETSNEETKSESTATETDESKKIVSTEDESKKIVSTEQKNTTNKSNFDPNTLSVDEIKLYVVGKWGSCNDSTIKNGSYIFLDEKKQLNIEFYRDGIRIVSTTLSSIEKIKINNKNLVRLTGRIFQYQSEFYKQTKKSRPIQTVWDIGVQDSLRVVQRTIWESPEIWADGGGPRSEEIKDGRLSNGNQVSAIERCQVISENKKDTNLTNSDGNNNFGIKGFVLGGALPKNIKFNNTITNRLDDGNLVTTVIFDTTILEVPFRGLANLLNDKIAYVLFFDRILDQELSKKEEYTDYFKTTRKLGPLTSYDFSKVSNDLVVLINSSLSNPKGQPKITKKVIDIPIAGICYQYVLLKKLNNNSDKGLETMSSGCNITQKLLEGQCRNCKSTSYEFAWKSKTTDVFVQTIVPESKDMPFAMNYLQITYQDIELQRLLKQINDKQNIQAETQKKKLLDDSKQRELQMNRERDDSRKKDF